MDKTLVSRVDRIAAMPTGIVGILVVLGWLYDVPVLTQVVPGWVSMKLPTALSFIGCSWLLMSREGPKRAGIGLFVVLTIMLGFTKHASVISTYGSEAPYTVSPGEPSYGTLACFLMFVFSELALTGIHKSFMGALVALAGILAIMGYVLDLPTLYYYWPGGSTGMAIHTAFGLTLLGVALAIDRPEN